MPSAIQSGSIPRILATGVFTVYVSTTGSDSNDGLTASTPFLTIQKAIDFVCDFLDVGSGATVTIQLADGTYTLAATTTIRPYVGGGSLIIIQGNTGTPNNVLVRATSGSFALFTGRTDGRRWRLSSFQIQGGGSNLGVDAGVNSRIDITGINVSTGLTIHFRASGNSLLQMLGSASTISGGGTNHISCIQGSFIQYVTTQTITVSGTPAFTTFALCETGSFIQCFSSTVTWSGAATGLRHSAILNAVINTNGGGTSYFPGNSAGTTATGGQFA